MTDVRVESNTGESDERLSRRGIAALLGSVSLLALSGCANPNARDNADPREENTGEASEALLVSGLYTVSSIAELRGLTAAQVADTQIVHLQGYYNPGDGGEGFFWCKPTDTAPDNGGTVIKENLSARRWYRETNGQPYSVKWFGAYGDGTNAPATRAAIQATIDAACAAGFSSAAVWIPPGVYAVDQAITIDGGGLQGPVCIQGAGNRTINHGTKIIPTTASIDIFRLINVNHGVVIRQIDIGGVVFPSGTPGAAGHAIVIQGCQTVEVSDVYIYQAWKGILVDSSSDVQLRRINIRMANVLKPSLPDYRFGVKVTSRTARVMGLPPANYTECLTVQVGCEIEGHTGYQQAHGFVFADSYETLILTNSGALNCDIANWLTADGGNPPKFYVNDCGVSDHCKIGWLLDSGAANANVQINNALCTSSYVGNYYISSTFQGDAQFANCRATFTASVGYYLGGTGLYSLSGCTAVNTGSASIWITNGARVSVVGGNFSDPGSGAPVIWMSSAWYCSITGATLKGGAAGSPNAVIYAANSLRLSIAGNVIAPVATSANGIYLLNCTDVAISGNCIPGWSGSTANGVYLLNSSYCTITGNRIHTFNYGVLENGSSTRSVVSSNALAGNGSGVSLVVGSGSVQGLNVS